MFIRTTFFTLGSLLLLISGALFFARQQEPISPWISFVSNRDGNWELYKMRPDGAEVTRLTSHPDREFPASWSPDGETLAFAARQEDAFNSNIYVMQADSDFAKNCLLNGVCSVPPTDQALQITDTGRPQQAMSPLWSPDGESILYLIRQRTGIEQYRTTLYTAKPNGTQITRLMQRSALLSDPQWSVDGNWIAYTSAEGQDQAIYRMCPDGSNIQRLTDNTNTDYAPAWSPIVEQPVKLWLMALLGMALLGAALHI